MFIFLKEAKEELVKALTIIFNKSMNEGKLPVDWKLGQITPIFKKGKRTEAGNYRPVSLTSVTCKILESIIREVLLEHMKQHLTDCQHGFLNGRSCTTQLLDSLGHWTESLDEGNSVDVIFLDFAKAFDSVPHLRLLKKLEGYGVQGSVLGWITDFLKNRKQRVSVGGSTSSWTDVLSGIPQGSVLGPVLFICFVNDMPEQVDNLIRMFADDTKIFAKTNTVEQHESLQKDLTSLQNWAEDWQLRFNAEKCKVMHLGGKNNRHSYEMQSSDGNSIRLVNTTCEKDLGVSVDPSLKFSKHCEKAASKANQILGMVRRSFDYINVSMLNQLFRGLIRPHLEYANIVWSPSLKKDISLIENVQRRASKMIPELKELEYEERLKKLNLPSLEYRRLRGDLIEAYKFTHDVYNVNSDNILPRCHSTLTRGHNYKVKKQMCKLDVRKNFFGLRVVNIWNNLPASVVDAPSVNAFKGRIDKHLRNHQFEININVISQKSKQEAQQTSETTTYSDEHQETL